MHVPGWHEATKDHQREGRLQMVGVIQEQHPDRAALFMQWKQMGWPILVDSLNLLEIDVVPLTVAIDEHGITRHVGLRLDDAAAIEEMFLARQYDRPASLAPRKPLFPDPRVLASRLRDDDARSWDDYGTSLVLAGEPALLDEAVAAFRRGVDIAPGEGELHFRLGVAHRLRYDSPGSRPEDFRLAVEHWQQALDANPNQYIWRRRLQQYGPRLAKPYPFYDWVTEAREAVRRRGEEPTPLRVEPGDSEFASPSTTFLTDAGAAEDPDPDGRILRDDGEFIHAEVVMVPPEVEAGSPIRAHVAFRPNLANKAHWNNEVDPLVLWVDPPDGWSVDRRLVAAPMPPDIVSQETRRVELEIRPPGGESGGFSIPAYALYYVCEDVNGLCLYRRQDLALRVSVR